MSDESPPVDSNMELPKLDESIKSLQISLELCRRKRASKRNTIKIGHQLEKLYSAPKTVLEEKEIEHRIDALWTSLEETQNDELSAYYIQQKGGEKRDSELGEGTLHRQLVRKLSD